MRNLLIAAAGAACLAAGFGGAAQAAGETNAQRLSAARVDFRDPTAVEAFHARLAQAARDVCRSPYLIDTKLVEADRACAEQALDDAIRAADKPQLTAAHQQRQTTRTARDF